jgi:UDP-N-acetylmuramyl pentapeptide phosphotransferase/UDP-N-acetylglucosamine-1-phosphate transferase
MNAVNIIDGFNGLSSGVVLLILASFVVVSYTQGHTDILTVASISIGAVLGFFVLNFPFGKIFLGDGGAYMLGFIVALLGIFLASNYSTISPWYILAIFIYPVWEVLFSIIRRRVKGGDALAADAHHLHTLIYKHVTQNNPLTSLFILLFILPFMVTSTLYANHSLTNIIVVFVFIVSYSSFYFYLYKKEMTNI